MALKPRKQHIPKLTREQVLQARNLFYRDLHSYKTIAEKFNVHEATAQKAIQGIGAFYSSIEDDIPQAVKDSRVPSRILYSITQSKKQSINPHTYNRRKRI